MAKTKISEYSTTNSSNTDINSINIDEGCAPSGINNAIREVMVHLKNWQTNASGDGATFANLVVQGTGSFTGAVTMSAGATLSGTNTLSGATVLAAQLGTSASPSIYFTSDTNTGIFSPTADTVAVATGGSERVRVDSSGNVGIGTSSPVTKLTVWTPTTQSNGGVWSNCEVALHNSTSVGDFSQIGFGYATGTTNAAGYFGLKSTSAAANGKGDFVFGLRDVTTDTAPTERARITSGGNFLLASGAVVGLNTADGSDNGYLAISGASADGSDRGGFIYLSGNERATDAGSLVLGAGNTTSGTGSPGVIAFRTGSNTERARINSNGNLLVGTVDAGAGAGYETRLAVDGGSTYDPCMIKWSGAATSAYVLRLWNTATSGDNLFAVFQTEGTPTDRGNIRYNRGSGVVAYNTSSDANLKNIIGDSDGKRSLEILNTTRIREFAWKDDPNQHKQIGVIAQELYETYPGAVTVGGDFEREREVTEEVEEKYTDEEGNTQTKTVTKVVGTEKVTQYRPWSVDKTAFQLHLVAGWQAHEKLLKEAMTRIEALEAEVAAMKAGNGN